MDAAVTDRLLTPADVARRCQVSTKTVLRAIHAGDLRASRLGRRGAYRVRAGDVDAWLDATASRTRPHRSVPEVSQPTPVTTRGGRLVVGDGMGRRQ